MDFLDETHTTRWASVCVFSNILLILLAIASSVLEISPYFSNRIVPLILPQTLLIAPLLLQLICLAVFTFSARSGALQLFKYQLQIPFLGRWMLPAVVLTLSLICLGVLSRALITANSIPLFVTIILAQLVFHCFHLLNLTWGFFHYLWTTRPRHYQPTCPLKKGIDIKSNIGSFRSSGHLSRAYSSLSESKDRAVTQQEKTHQIPNGSSPQIQASNTSDTEVSNETGEAQVIDHG
jgi:hypothetical protein